MVEQSYANHAKLVPAFHRLLFPLSMICFIGSLVNLYEAIGDHSRFSNASLITALSVGLMLCIYYTRIFPLQAQDRAIRAEENLRHYVLTGKLLDPRLTLKQIVALRFTSDAEFPALAVKAAVEGIAPKDIKQGIRTWRADHDRL